MCNWLSDRMEHYPNWINLISVCASPPATLDNLKQVSDYLQAVAHETYRKIGQNFGVRINAYLNRGGAHIENIIYKDFA